MKLFLILSLLFFIKILPVSAGDPVASGDSKQLPVPAMLYEAGNDSVTDSKKYEAKQRFQAPGNPYMIEREFVKDPVNHYRQEIHNKYTEE